MKQTKPHSLTNNNMAIQSSTTSANNNIVPNHMTSNNISFSHYLNSLCQTPHRLRKRMLATWTPDQELNQVRQRSGADMKRRLKWHDLLALGLGGMLGVGVFVTTGEVAAATGPAVFISYLIAGVAALLSSLCYAEFSVQIPVAGGAFSYLRLTFGEFVGYFAGANILMEYVLSNAGAARTFTQYLSVIFGQNHPNAWRIEVEGFVKGHHMHLDLPAVAIILLLTLVLSHSTKESSMLNMVLTVFHVVFFGFIIIAGFYNGSTDNLVKPSGLAPLGVRHVIDGAAIVYFGYIGYDSASTMAEEIQNPSKSLPIGIVGSVVITTIIYCLMALSLCLMVPYNAIEKEVAFSAAFRRINGWRWAGNFVGAGASLGIVASLLVAMLGQARYLCVIGRAMLVPSWLAKVHPSTGTPLNATLFLGLCTASIALFTELEIVLQMISIGTLVVFFLVANALVYRRYAITGANPPSLVLLFLLLLSSAAVGFSATWKHARHHWWGLPLFGGSALALIGLFHYAVPAPSAAGASWSVPYMPWPPALSIFLNVFLMGTLKPLSFQRFAIWTALITLFYMLYGVHRTYQAEEMGTRGDCDVDNRAIMINSSAQQTKLDNIQLVPVITQV